MLYAKKHNSTEEKYRKALNVIHAVYRLVNSYTELKDLLRRMVKLVLQATNCKQCTLSLFYVNAAPVLRAKCDFKKKPVIDKIPKKRLTKAELDVYSTGKVLKRGKDICFPLVADKILGTLKMNQILNFSPEDENLLSIVCEQIATAIRVTLLYQEEQRLLLGTVKLISGFLEEKVPRLHSHGPLFKALVKEISKEMKLPSSNIKILELASILHDTGKIKVPTRLLTKSRPLSEEEMKIIKKHPLFSAQILKRLQLLKPVIPIILHHHERYDGKGYPSGLKKGQIPLESRIMSVVDAFDAMVSQRPYKERKELKEAVEEIKRFSGTQFDPKVVDTFLKVLKRKKIKKLLKSYNI